MAAKDHELFSAVPRLPAGSLLAQLLAGECTPSLFPPALRFGGPGAPPPAAAEVNSRQSPQKRLHDPYITWL